MMRRILLRIAYDGTRYAGFQVQPGGILTVEGVLNEMLSGLTGEEILVTGGSRTDAGVHALDNVAVFDTASRIPGEKFSYALNERLPEDIKIQSSCEVAADFHPRKTPCLKTYEYHILSAPFPQPLARLYAHYTYHELDTDAMDRAARFLIGEHDFTSFSSIYSQARSPVRTITAAQTVRAGQEIVIRVQGTGFLYNMVRIIAGTLMEVGRGRKTPEDIPQILEKKDRRAAGPTAPACGLVLKEYRFLREDRKQD